MAFLAPKAAPQMPAPATPPPPFISAPKPSKKGTTQPTFLGTDKTPTGDMSAGVGMERGKTLLGQ